jgi:hypothetical protein
MKTWLLYALLLGAVIALSLIGHTAPSDSPVPSLQNPGPQGGRALALYLQETGRAPVKLPEILLELPPGLRTLVIAAPAGRDLREDERDALDRWVRGGGRLLYLASRPPQHRPVLASWLGVHSGPSWGAVPDPALTRDPRGATLGVQLRAGITAGVKQLRLPVAASIKVDDAMPVAERGALWWRSLGEGELWIAAGPDLLESRRLDLLDNLQLWENLAAAGPIGFAESLHQLVPPPPVSRAIWGALAQLLLIAAVMIWSRGTRLGPARPELAVRHRASLEYVASLASLTRRARVEGELLLEAIARLRARLHERLGISIELPDAEAALEAERLCGLPAEPLRHSLHEARAAAAGPLKPRDYARFIAELARAERVVSGRAASSRDRP